MVADKKVIKNIKQDLDHIFKISKKYNIFKQYEFITSERYSTESANSKTIPKELKIILSLDRENIYKSQINILQYKYGKEQPLLFFTTQKENMFSNYNFIDYSKQNFMNIYDAFNYFDIQKQILTKESNPGKVSVDNTFTNLSNIIYSTRVAIDRLFKKNIETKILKIYDRI